MSNKYWCDICEGYVRKSCDDPDCPVVEVEDFEADDNKPEEVQPIDFHKFENDSILTSFNDEGGTMPALMRANSGAYTARPAAIRLWNAIRELAPPGCAPPRGRNR